MHARLLPLLQVCAGQQRRGRWWRRRHRWSSCVAAWQLKSGTDASWLRSCSSRRQRGSARQRPCVSCRWGGVGCPPSATPEPRQLAGLLRGVPGAAGICRPDQRSCVLAGRKRKAAGGLAGALSWLSVYPFDVVKTRCQAGTAAALEEAPYRGALDCARRSYASEGAGVFVRGLATTLGRAFLVNGAIFSAYELAHKLLTQRQQPQQPP